MNLRRFFGPLLIATGCAACSSQQPRTIVGVEQPVSAPAAEATPPAIETSVPDASPPADTAIPVTPAATVSPEPQAAGEPPHGYSRWHLQPGDYHGQVQRPATVKLLLAQDHWSTELASSSGNPSFDQAALDAAPRGQYQVAVDAAGNPATVLICFDSGKACPAEPSWSGPEHLRDWANIEAGLERLKGGLLKVYSDAVGRGEISAEGRLTVNLTIEPSGAVSHCAIAKSSYTNEAFNKAFTEQSCNLNFGAGGYDRSFIYGYPVEFHASGAMR